MSEAIKFSSFADELTKIALVGAAAKRVGALVRKGWEEGGSFRGQGRVTKYLPVGGKSVALGLTGAMVPGAVAKEDPYGAGRSRTERVTGLAAGTLGGLAGAGALMGGPGARLRWLRAGIGGLAGSIGAEYGALTPFRRARQQAAKPAVEDPRQRAMYLQQAQRGIP